MGCSCAAQIGGGVSQRVPTPRDGKGIHQAQVERVDRQGLPSLSRAAVAAASSPLARSNGGDRTSFARKRRDNIHDVYIFGEQIGKGNYGIVSRATHLEQGYVRAVKSISCKSKYAQREISCLKHMDHPGIIRVFETFQNNHIYYVVMELCTGGDLETKIKNEVGFTEVDAAFTMQQIFRIVQYMHNRGIVHRDLKANNLLLLHDGPIASNVVKLVDFGFARDWRPGQILTSMLGTPYYVSPQLLEGRYTNKCDVWSCGVLMYFMLIGRMPFAASTELQLYAAIRRARPSFNRTLPRPISADSIDLMTHLLLYDECRRFSAQQASEHRWMTWTTTPRLHPMNLDVYITQADVQTILSGSCQAETPSREATAQNLFSQVDANDDGRRNSDAFEHMLQPGAGLEDDHFFI